MFKEGHFDYKIEAQDTKEKKERLEETLTHIQLAYADNLYHTQTTDGKKFSQILEKINTRFLFPLKTVVQIEKGRGASFTELEAGLKSYLAEIDTIYETQCQEQDDNTFESISKKLSPLSDYVKGVEARSRSEHSEAWENYEAREEQRLRDTEKSGIFECCLVEESNMDESSRKLLEEKGFNEYDKLLDLQIPDIFLSQQKFSKESLLRSFEGAADLIINKYPETKAVAAHSWLFSSPAAQKLAPFEVLGEDVFLNWSQLVDQDGNIHKERFNEFIKTGKLPYRSLFAYMKTEDFLAKFATKKGKLELKELNPQWLKEVAPQEKQAEAEGAIFETAWLNKKLQTEEDITSLLSAMPASKKRLERAGVYDEFISILKNNPGFSIKELNEKEGEKMNLIRESLQKSVDQSKYIVKELILD